MADSSADSQTDHPPFHPGETHVPEYYKLEVVTLRGEKVVIDAFAVINAIHRKSTSPLGSHPFLGFAIKYLVRLGCKPGVNPYKDLAKAQESLERLSHARD